MTKKTNYKVGKDFDYAGQAYKAGDTFKRPDDWELDEEFTRLKKQRRPDLAITAFAYPVQLGVEEHFEGSMLVRTPVIDYRRAVLPVE
jgi:hypothetical protein